MLDLLIILCRCSSYERTDMVLFSSIFLVKSDMSVEFQQSMAVLHVFKIARAVHLCCDTRNFSPVNAPSTFSTSWPLRTPQTGKVSRSGGLLQKFAQLRLSALAHLENSRTGAANVSLFTSFPLSHAPELHNGRAVRNVTVEFCLQLYAEQIQPSAKNSHFKTCRFQCIWKSQLVSRNGCSLHC